MYSRLLRRIVPVIVVVAISSLLRADPPPITPIHLNERLTQAEVFQIISQAASTALAGQTIVVSDRDGNILGIYGQAPVGNDGVVVPGQTPDALVKPTDLNGQIRADPNDPTHHKLIGALVENTAAKYALIEATRRARTVAFFESREDAFTTRTARFIIQDRFPEPIDNTEAGPLLGVEFSGALGTDAFPPGIGTGLGNGMSGDPGGIPLYKNGFPVGGIGVAGDGSDVAVRYDLVPQAQPGVAFDQQTPRFKSDPNGTVYRGAEEQDFDEAVALAGAQGFMASAQVQATLIFVNGLRFPFTANSPATGRPAPGAQGLTDFTGEVLPPPTAFSYLPLGKADAGFDAANVTIYPRAALHLNDGTFMEGFVKSNNNPAAGGAAVVPGIPFVNNASQIPVENPDGTQGFVTGNFGFIKGVPSGNDPTALLDIPDVTRVIRQAASEANNIRAAIRLPSGVPVKVHIAVVDSVGSIIGVFQMFDGTVFSFDVAVQKARTSLFFSDDTHAFTCRSVGFMSDGEFPPAQENGITGPLYQLQNYLSLPQNAGMFLPTVTRANGKPVHNKLGDGINIFPGGAPLYKNGHLVGAVGISGDGVDQDDLISTVGSEGYEAAPQFRCTHLTSQQIVSFIQDRVNTLGIIPPPGSGLPQFTFPPINFTGSPIYGSSFDIGFLDPDVVQNRDGLTLNPADTIITRINERLNAKGLQSVRIPFHKFPRNPDLH